MSVPLHRAPRPDDQRTSRRLICSPGQVVAMKARGTCHVVPVYDMSDGGMMIRLPTKLSLGEAVSVAIGKGAVVEAEICWMDGERAGLAFRG